MPTLRVDSFDGLVPRTSATMLSDNQAQVADNVKLYARELRAWRGPELAYTPSVTPLTIYRLYNFVGDSMWLTWPSLVNVATSPINDNGEARVYFTGDGVPKKTTYALAMGSNPPATSLALGLPEPIVPPSITLTTDGTGTAQTRAYVWTYISQFGTLYEESAPSPADTVTVKPTGATVTVTFGSLPTGTTGVTARRLYRSVTGTSSTSYQFVAEVPIATPSFADTLSAAFLGGVLETIGWRPPPEDMQGMTNLASGTGVLAGFYNNVVCFSEPFYPHAWPVAYQLTVPFKIVAIAPFGSSLVVMTDRFPYIISGGSPGSMSMEQVPIIEPCVSATSVVVGDSGVMYASPNGLVAIGYNSRNVTTKDLYTRDEWEAIGPENLVGCMLNGRYIGSLSGSDALVLDAENVPALSMLALDATAFHVDSHSAEVFFVGADGKIYELDALAADLLTYTWRSKRWQVPRGLALSSMRVDADYTTGSLTVKVYGAGSLLATLTPSSLSPFKIPPMRVRELELELTGTRIVRSIAISTTVAELQE